ncbi:MAG: sialidase family protein [Paracoccus sp. (in: a-proteobacteria)]|uniref:sialidase family protein n=1 Tax=Paracoccus sp. TaxID=267 RepID=UPI003242F9FB
MAFIHSSGAVTFDGDRILLAAKGLVRSDDAGRTWTALPAPGSIVALAGHSGRILAGLHHGVALSNDSGQSWQVHNNGLPEARVLAVTVAARAPDTFHAALEGDGVWMSEDAGLSWSLVMDRPWLDEAERDLLALTSVDLESGMGGIWIYAGTETGLTRVPDCFCRWQDVQPGNAMDALVSDDAPPLEAPLPEGEAVLALVSAPSSPAFLYAALPSGVWSSKDSGVVWAQVTSRPATTLAVHPQDDTYLAAIMGGRLHLSRDGGINWTAVAVA